MKQDDLLTDNADIEESIADENLGYWNSSICLSCQLMEVIFCRVDGEREPGTTGNFEGV